MGEFRGNELVKLFMPLALIIILFIIIVFIVIPSYFKNYLISTEHDKIKQLVESEIQLLGTLEKDITAGEISAEEARNLAINLIHDQRHGENNEFYFWIIDMEPVLIMHPFRPDLENTYVGDFTDPEGNRLFQEMVDLIREDGGGYVEYQWQILDDPTRITDKKSYVEAYSPWGWIIGTGFYKESTFNEINGVLRLITVVSVTVMIIIVIVSVVLIKQRFEIRKRNKYFARSLLESEKRYKVLIDSMNEGFLIQDQNENILLVNAQLCIMLGYREQDLLGKRIIDFILEGDRVLYAERIKERLQAEDSPYEISFNSADGKAIPVIVSPRRMFSGDGSFDGSFSTITNVSSLKRIEEELSSSLEEKDILIKEVHHRVKNNLQIITSLLSMQKDEIRKPVLTEMLTVSEARIYSMALVYEILYESENFKYIYLDEYINRLVQNQLVTFRVGDSGIDIDIRIEKTAVSIDRASHCGLVINELVTNAINHAFKKADDDRRIMIRAAFDDDQFIIVISDNGSGIPDSVDHSEHVGLKLVSLLIEQMRGTVSLTTSDNSGSRFEIRLPKEDPEL